MVNLKGHFKTNGIYIIFILHWEVLSSNAYRLCLWLSVHLGIYLQCIAYLPWGVSRVRGKSSGQVFRLSQTRPMRPLKTPEFYTTAGRTRQRRIRSIRNYSHFHIHFLCKEMYGQHRRQHIWTTHESEGRRYWTIGHHVRQTAEFNFQGGRTLNKSRLGRNCMDTQEAAHLNDPWVKRQTLPDNRSPCTPNRAVAIRQCRDSIWFSIQGPRYDTIRFNTIFTIFSKK